MSRYEKSATCYEKALAHIVGGVNSPARSFKAVGGGAPVFMNRGQGAYMYDVDGNRYIDYLAAYGPGILGHAHPEIVATMIRAAQNGTLYGTPTPWEVELADRLNQALPSLERVRFVSSGTEAVMSAVRVARAYTGRPKVVKMEGCYHGHSDFALIAAGSGPSQLGQPDSAGVTESVAKDVLTVRYNDLGALEEAFAAWGEQIACVITEPIVGNFGIVNPAPGYLQAVKELTHRHGALLIFDEVITAFRVAFGGAQTLLGVEPDLTTLGKAIGGGVALGAYGGKAEIMDFVAPLGPAYQAGTLAGNPLSVQTALTSLDILGRPGIYERLENDGAYLSENLMEIARRHGHTVQLGRNGSMFTIYFTDKPVVDYAGADAADKDQFAAMFRGFLDRGICLAPSRFEAWMISIQHTRADLDETLEKAEEVFASMSR
ncbi:MAG TPA: glutamate-1-semialdehyde 2,1-aminomutase [Symbiobacteriaceae bacterium]|nr:glutamate-1-semialdehyde 2,1-aminomutase [Symbiobacteriaceae bacterium]